MLLPRNTTWIIVAACFLVFFGVSASACIYYDLLSYHPVVNYYKQPSYTAITGFKWTATSTYDLNTVTIKYCTDEESDDFELWAVIGTYSGDDFNVVATSTNHYHRTDLKYDSAAGCYSDLDNARSFYFNDYPVTSGGTYMFGLYLSANVDRGFFLNKHTLDSAYDIVEGCDLGGNDCTEQDTISPWFSFIYDQCLFDDEVEVIENPDYDPDLIVEIESEEAIDIAKYKECIITEDCFWKFGYNSTYDDGIFYLIYDQDPRSRDGALDTVALGSRIIRSDRFEVPSATSTGIVDYCVFLEDADANLELICGLQVKWYDEFEASALAMQECISTACDDVSTSTAWWDVDFQGAIECGFRKTTCWLTTPSGAAKIRYREIVGQSGQPGEIQQNFPLSVIAQFRSLFTAASIATTSTSTQYFAPIRVYDPTTGGMRTLAYMFNNKMLENGLGQYYDFYYDWATKILWLLFGLYFFDRIYRVINPTAGSLFDLVLPGKKQDYPSGIQERQTGVRNFKDIRKTKKGRIVDIRPTYGPEVTDLRRKY